jgi:hypothetical protein
MTLPATFNLARRPFLNRRPIGRLAIALWAIGLGLALWNVRLYLQFLPGRHRSPEEQRQLVRQIEEERATLGRLRAQVGGFDGAQMEEVAAFVNRCIAARTFSWSALFDRLSEVLPDDVRLVTLSPKVPGERAGRTRSAAEAESAGVLLDVTGVARSDEALLDFIDNLFSHEQFRAPNLQSERRLERGDREFSLSVVYDAVELAAAPVRPIPAEPAVETEGELPTAESVAPAAPAERSPA